MKFQGLMEGHTGTSCGSYNITRRPKLSGYSCKVDVVDLSSSPSFTLTSGSLLLSAGEGLHNSTSLTRFSTSRPLLL